MIIWFAMLHEADSLQQLLEVRPHDPGPHVVQAILSCDSQIRELIRTCTTLGTIPHAAAVRPASCERPLSIRRFRCPDACPCDAEGAPQPGPIVGHAPTARECSPP